MTRSVISVNASNINGTIGSSQIADDAVTAAKIADGTLTHASITGNPFSVRQVATNNLWSGITHGANNGNAYGYYYSDVSMAGHVTSNTIALMIRVYYVHNGSANHGYLGGYVIQAGETDAYPNRADWYMAHYNDYYNTDTSDFLMPWNPAGTQSIRFNVTSSHNTSTSNTYAIRIVGTIERAS